MMFIDGGFDYRVIYYVVKLVFIVLFKRLGLEMFVVGRIVLGYFWINLVECIMLFLNLVF